MKKFKNVLSVALVFALFVTMLAGCSPKDQETSGGDTEVSGDALFTPGTYEGAAQGFGGEVVAVVTLSETAIENIEVTGNDETENIGSTAIDLLPGEMLKKQSTDVDVVTGATITSNAIIEAVNAALLVAGVDPASLVGDASGGGEKSEEVLDVDVVVIGGGGAGMTAAITAKEAGLDVVIVEKMAMLGGNTSKSTGGMNAAETKYQEAAGIEDSVQTFIDDTMEGGYQIADLELVTIMAEKSAESIDWLDSIGAPLPKVSFSGGATNSRIHAPEDGSPVGVFLVSAFSNKIDELDIPVYYNTEATELLMDGGAVVGVAASSSDVDYTINAKVTVLATGGFGANEDLYVQYRPELKGFVTTNTPGATGDGIVMAEKVGAALVDVEQIQIHPTVEQATSIMVTEGVRGDGAILVNQKGERFTNEMGTRDVVSAAVIAEDGGYAYIIFDQNLRESLAAIETYISNGIVVEGATIEELAENIGVDPAVLADTLATWNASVPSKNDEAFGRETGMEHDLSAAPYYAIQIAPGVHHTMGGVKIDTTAHVINTDGEVIPGLLAAGEVTGGIHGGNRIGGNAVADIVVFGRIAGQSAIEAVEAE